MIAPLLAAPPLIIDPAAVLQEMTEALINSQDRLFALRALTQINVESLGRAEAMERTLSAAMDLTDSDAVVLVDDRTVWHAGDATGAAELVQEIGDSIVGDSSPSAVKGGCAVVAPLNDRSAGTLSLGFLRKSGPAYTTGDLQLIESVVSATEMMRRLTRLHMMGIKRARIEREHELASNLAQAVLSAPLPSMPGVDLFARTTPASLAGGDFLTFAAVKDLLWFAVGDVAGKGLPAAMVMTRMVGAARVAFLTQEPGDVTGAMSAVGAELFDYLDDVGLFVTLVVGAYQPETGDLYVCNAGHSPVMLMRDGGIKVVGPSPPPLGIGRQLRGSTENFHLNVGDVLIVGSDGLAEQENAAGAMVGYERIERVCTACQNLPAAELAGRILAAIDTHADGAAPSDDCTLVVLRSVAER